jgi:hypothetical protein
VGARQPPRAGARRRAAHGRCREGGWEGVAAAGPARARRRRLERQGGQGDAPAALGTQVILYISEAFQIDMYHVVCV